MFVVPTDGPVTNPVEPFTVATPVAELLHTPPVIASVKAVVPPPEHIVIVPLIALPPATVSVVVFVHPFVDDVYDIVVVPFAIPVIVPDADPIVAIDVVLLAHVPPVGVPVNVVLVVLPDIHAVADPVIAGKAFIVTIALLPQPDTV